MPQIEWDAIDQEAMKASFAVNQMNKHRLRNRAAVALWKQLDDEENRRPSTPVYPGGQNDTTR